MAHPYLLASGGILIVLGFLLFRWASRYDLKGLALDTAWQVVKNRGRVDTETDLGTRLKQLQAERSHVRRAGMLAGHATRHFAAQIASIAALVCLALGAVLIGVALWWQ